MAANARARSAGCGLAEADVSLWPDFVAKVENRPTLKISRIDFLRRFSAPLRRSVIDFGSTDVVPHIAVRKTHQRL
jgi:hypothetical protein